MEKNEIIKFYGSSYMENTFRLCEISGLKDLILKKTKLPPEKIRIGLKPNLVAPSPAIFGSTTHPEVTEGIILYLKENGFNSISILEGSWVGDSTEESFRECGYLDLKNKYSVDLFDCKKDVSIKKSIDISKIISHYPDIFSSEPGLCKNIHSQCGSENKNLDFNSGLDSVSDSGLDSRLNSGLDSGLDLDSNAASDSGQGSFLDINISKRALGLDYLIDIPVLKGHAQVRLTAALKNLKGLIPDSEKRRFHMLGLHVPIAALSKLISPDFVILDHISGDLELEDGGNPIEKNCILSSPDPVLIDSYSSLYLGFSPEEIPYIKMAELLGTGSSSLKNASISIYREQGFKCPSLNESRFNDLALNDQSFTHSSLSRQNFRDSSLSRQSFTHSSLNRQNFRDSSDEKPILVIPADSDLDPFDPFRNSSDRLLSIKQNIHSSDTCSACFSQLLPALEKLDAEGCLDQIKELFTTPFSIGQGFKGKTAENIGVGQCCSRFRNYIKGCPPHEEDIYSYLKIFADKLRSDDDISDRF